VRGRVAPSLIEVSLLDLDLGAELEEAGSSRLLDLDLGAGFYFRFAKPG
jgi:hypothetical protein